jgi:TatD DNase family protein
MHTLHSFTDSQENLEHALKAGLYIGVNGISTFTKDEAQKAMFGSIPLESLVLETDAPFLTPAPMRGTLNEPAFVTLVAKFHADLRSISLEELSGATSQNATRLFHLK